MSSGEECIFRMCQLKTRQEMKVTNPKTIYLRCRKRGRYKHTHLFRHTVGRLVKKDRHQPRLCYKCRRRGH